MNKFLVFPCVKQDEEVDGYNGTVVCLACITNISFVLFFPVSDSNAQLINYVLQDTKDNNIDMHLLSVYKTMIDSWKAGNRYMSGIIMDALYDDESKEDIIAPTLIISDSLGNVDTILNVDFVHAILLASMERKEIIVTDALIDKLLPIDEDEDDEDEESEDKNNQKFPVDKQILDIARDIMGGKKNDIEVPKDKKTNAEKTPKSPKQTKPPKQTK